jgi:glycosyltransferase involved in cell wall biosynthesis
MTPSLFATTALPASRSAAGDFAPRRSPDAARAVPILFVHNGQDWIRGSERCLLDLLAGLDRERFYPVLLCNAPTLATAAAALGISVHRSSGWHQSSGSLLPDRKLVGEVRTIVRHYGIRLIHANDTDPIKTLIPVARGAAIPLLAHLHIIDDADGRRWSGLHQVSRAVGCSRAAIAGLLEDGLAPDVTDVIYNGVDAERLSKGNCRGLRDSLGIGEDAITLTSVGSLIHRKGLDVTLSALAMLQRDGSDFHLLVAGEGEERQALESQARELGVASRVHFLGLRSDVGALLRDATDICVSAARQEAFPLNLLEAAFCGAPIVASAIDPHRESVVEGETGDLFAEGDPAAMAGAISALADDSLRRRRYGLAGRQRVLSQFLVERFVARFEETYDDLLARPRASYGWLGETRWPPAYTEWAKRAVKRRIPLLH